MVLAGWDLNCPATVLLGGEFDYKKQTPDARRKSVNSDNSDIIAVNFREPLGKRCRRLEAEKYLLSQKPSQLIKFFTKSTV